MRRGIYGGRSWHWVLLALVAILSGGWQQPPPAPQSKLPSAAEINSILKELSDITGFQIRKQLPFESITREQVNKYLREQIRRSVKPDEIRAEETTLKKFGFVPPDFDLKQTTIDLLTEQAAAFYDFRRKKLFISDWAAVNMRDVALIHELAHALADQNFAIEKFTTKGPDNSESSLAREAVVEGQASWLMIEVGARRAGRTLADPETARQLLGGPDNSQPAAALPGDSETSEYPVFSKAPLYLRRTLTFPYDDGEKFQQAVFLHDGKRSFSKVFEDPPISTAQVIHPEQYFRKTPLASPVLPKPVRHAKPFVTGALGELETTILLEQYLDPDTAHMLAPKLKGADYRVDETKPAHRMMLVYESEWSDPDAAAQYFEAYQRVLRAKWKSVDVTVSDADRFSGKSEDGYFTVSRDGNKVLSEEGFEQPL
ncbi:MAG TPA: hypothetical protein VG297_14495 [Bryobacteraceae bacterium]|jgi:hypothetical protein|nr:hypothetical protein [Bryobacteraceae bacterium]